MKVALINGNGGVGKDTFIQICQKEYSKDKIWNISTVDLVKEAAKILGWNGEKDERSRKFLSDLKDLSEDYSNLSEKYISKVIEEAKTTQKVEVIFVHVREPEQIKKLKEEFNAVTLLIKNNRVKQIETNHADKDVENFNYNFVIENNGSIIELTEKAVKFLKEIGVL